MMQRLRNEIRLSRIAKLDGGLTITTYTNILDTYYSVALPHGIKEDINRFKQYVRFKSEIKMKYVLAILNSRVAQFIYKRQYNSVKVLRAHIESIPIPKISVDKQDEIIEIVDCLIKGSTEREAIGFYEKLDDYIRKIFLLSESEYKTVKNAVDDENKFITTYEKQ